MMDDADSEKLEPVSHQGCCDGFEILSQSRVLVARSILRLSSASICSQSID